MHMEEAEVKVSGYQREREREYKVGGLDCYAQSWLGKYIQRKKGRGLMERT